MKSNLFFKSNLDLILLDGLKKKSFKHVEKYFHFQIIKIVTCLFLPKKEINFIVYIHLFDLGGEI